MTTGPEYEISARAYLGRARALLAGRAEGEKLFYAAYELRCCVEARQLQYALALGPHFKGKVKVHKLVETKNRLQRVYDPSRITYLEMQFSPDEPIYQFYYTPVTEHLVKETSKLGEYLHCSKMYRKASDPWWDTLRAQLSSVYKAAWIACKGNLWVPPLWNPVTQEVASLKVDGDDPSLGEKLSACQATGTRILVKVDYLSTPPPEWEYDFT
ncbi:hypothetical protein [Kordiimonas sp.]|uniref:hypothetical protein n=1 Tax=Kordiimonas sp. TaxID=1970157 RepID=UPI003A8EA6C2